jgi:hypothetical protein
MNMTQDGKKYVLYLSMPTKYPSNEVKESPGIRNKLLYAS